MQGSAFTWEQAVDGQDHGGPQKGKGPGKKDKKAKKGGKKTEKVTEKTGKSSETSSTDGEEKAHEVTTESGKEPFKIHDLEFNIAKGEFLGVVGNVGSGKTSFLASLAGEMRKVNGDAIIGGSIAYCPQNAWIQK
ncbi:Multidrug resistance-associated protein 1 [Talaromyces pinophilus]|nr:Multidrug resistance-associated protein 1 [Talaromyces pinophilus]